MEFWIFFVCVCIGFVFLEKLVPERYKKFVPMCFMVFITFIAAFRYQIGWDYGAYESLFLRTEIGDIYPEVTFQLLAVFLRENNFSAQMLFLVYAILTGWFLWRGLTYYLKSSNDIVFAIIVFVLIKILYWDWMFGYVRQGLAGAMFFWGTKFILEQKLYKYLLTIIFCMSIHFSAVVLVVCYWIPKTQLSKIKVLAYIFLAIPLYLVAPSVIGGISDMLGIYQGLVEHGFVRATLVINTIIGIVSIVLFRNENNLSQQRNFVFNMYSLSVIAGIIFGVSVATYRLSTYFQIFQMIFWAFLSNDFKSNSQYLFKGIVIIAFSIFYLSAANVANNDFIQFGMYQRSPNNINYKFNFQLFQ